MTFLDLEFRLYLYWWCRKNFAWVKWTVSSDQCRLFLKDHISWEVYFDEAILRHRTFTSISHFVSNILFIVGRIIHLQRTGCVDQTGSSTKTLNWIENVYRINQLIVCCQAKIARIPHWDLITYTLNHEKELERCLDFLRNKIINKNLISPLYYSFLSKGWRKSSTWDCRETNNVKDSFFSRKLESSWHLNYYSCPCIQIMWSCES